jgi:hypothetical protein
MTDQPPRCRDGACAHMAPGLCAFCEAKVDGWLRDLPQLLATLADRSPAPCCHVHADPPTRPALGIRATPYEPTHPHPVRTAVLGQASDIRVAGSRERPLPGGAAALSWLGPAAGDDRSHLDLGDSLTGPMQHGAEPLLSHLTEWVRLAREELGRVAPDRTVAAVLSWLRINNERISEQPWADEYAREIHRMWCTANTLAGTWNPKPEPVRGVACPWLDCDGMTLFRHPGHDGRWCHAEEGGCGRWISDDDFERWVKQSAHWAREAG